LIAFDRSHIRTRLTLWFVAALAVVLVLYCGAAGFFLLRDLRSQLVKHAIQDLETVEGLLSFNARGLLTIRDDYHNHPESKEILERLLEVLSPTGETLLRNDRMGDRSFGPILQREGQGGYSERDFQLPDGSKVVLVSRFHAVDGRPTIIRLAYPVDPIWQQFRADLVALLLPAPLILVAAGFGGYLLASRYLRPIQHLARYAQNIGVEQLHERLPVNPADGELADLAQSFNLVLLRLEQSFEQLRRFTADASHELRTPLSTIRSVGEVGLQNQCTQEGYRDVIGSMLEEANRLTRLVDSLLAIARADAGGIRVNASRFPVMKLLRECESLFEALLEENGQRLKVEGNETTLVSGDWVLLRQALVNVVHNAIKHTPRAGAIFLRAKSEGEQLLIEVEDSGPGIPESERAKVFDRFYRVEQGRQRDTGGAGLGLAIARWTVELHGGTIVADASAPGGCLIRMSLPTAGSIPRGAGADGTAGPSASDDVGAAGILQAPQILRRS
jgi:heavy metal sensor kinase